MFTQNDWAYFYHQASFWNWKFTKFYLLYSQWLALKRKPTQTLLTIGRLGGEEVGRWYCNINSLTGPYLLLKWLKDSNLSLRYFWRRNQNSREKKNSRLQCIYHTKQNIVLPDHWYYWISCSTVNKAWIYSSRNS